MDAIKVNDIVEIKVDGLSIYGRVIVHEAVVTTISTQEGSYCVQDEYPEVVIVRKVERSEAIIRFGCLSGTVEPNVCKCCKDKVFILHLETGGFIEIPFDALDPASLALVRRLVTGGGE